MISTACFVLLTLPIGQMDEEFHCDFSGGELHPVLSRFGPNAAWAMKSDSSGIRITLQANRREKAAVGIEPRFVISGDFEITLGYEVLSVDKPSTGQGAGVKIWGRIQAEEFQAMTLGHLMDSEGASEFAAIFAQGKEGAQRRFEAKELATEAKRGRLRLLRTGSELTFLAADGETEEFQELQRVEVGGGDIPTLRISATTSGDACGVSIRLIDLAIRAGDLPSKMQKEQVSSWGSFLVWLAVVAVVGTGGALLWRYWPVVWRHLPGSR